MQSNQNLRNKTWMMAAGLLALAACNVQEPPQPAGEEPAQSGPAPAPEEVESIASAQISGGMTCSGCTGPGFQKNCSHCECIPEGGAAGEQACIMQLRASCRPGSAPACANGRCDCMKGLVASTTNCTNSCGVFNPSRACQCDLQCNQFGDCCPDKPVACPSFSCLGRCGNFNPSAACQCDAACVQHGDCCGDRARFCVCSCDSLCAIFGNCCTRCF